MNVIKKHTNVGGGYQEPNRIIIHAMAETIIGLPANEYLESAGLSAHYLIAVSGDILECRPPNKKAWHAKGYNTGSIGIEILVEGEHTYESFLNTIETDWCKPEQMKAVISLVKVLKEQHHIEKVDRHSDIDPIRKFDPGIGFDWEFFIDNI